MPETLNIKPLQGSGLQPGEVLMSDAAVPAAPTTRYENPGGVAQLVEMGFPSDGCRRAVHLTQNAGLEAAMAWVMEHMGDPDFADPFPPSNNVAGGAGAAVSISEENTAMVMSMGFSRGRVEGWPWGPAFSMAPCTHFTCEKSTPKSFCRWPRIQTAAVWV